MYKTNRSCTSMTTPRLDNSDNAPKEMNSWKPTQYTRSAITDTVCIKGAYRCAYVRPDPSRGVDVFWIIDSTAQSKIMFAAGTIAWMNSQEWRQHRYFVDEISSAWTNAGQIEWLSKLFKTWIRNCAVLPMWPIRGMRQLLVRLRSRWSVCWRVL